MLLTDYFNKSIFVANQARGVCIGIGFSLKTQAIKCLLCASAPHQSPIFAISFSAVERVTENIELRRLRALLPTGFSRVTVGNPVYSYDGDFLGFITDAEIQNGALLQLFTDRQKAIPATAIFACNDAVILRKNQPYPLGQRIPAPVLLQINDKSDGLVTRPLLRTAMAKGALIKLTLSLPPFNHAV